MQHEPKPIPEEFSQTSETLVKALPYMREFAGATFIIKYGGHAMGDETLSQKFAHDVVLMKQVGINPIVVHGGGPQIAEMLERLKIQSEFIDGLRVTDRATVDIVEMVLAGRINKSIVSAINAVGGQAVGLCGKDANLIRAEKLRRTRRDPESNIEQILDLGFVGEPVEVDPSILSLFHHSEAIPVIAPIGIGSQGETYNINADTAAGAIAEATHAEKLVMMTDVEGILNPEMELITHISASEAKQLINKKTISGGMIPKVETCIRALEEGVHAAHILDGRIPHVVLVEIFTEHGVGTMLTL